MSIPTPDPVPSPLASEVLPPRDDVPETIAGLDLSDQHHHEFEFTPAQQRLMDDLGRKMQMVGLIGVVLGMLMLLALVTDISTLGMARTAALSLVPIVFILVGSWTRGAGHEFHEVAVTEERDLSHLMGALEYQAKIFRFAYWLLIALVALTIIGAIVSFAMSRGW